MKRIHVSLLDASPAGPALRAAGTVEGDFLVLSDEAFRGACAPFAGRANPALLGNRLRSALQRVGVAYLVHRLMRGRDCGCTRRAAWLNRYGLRIELCLWAVAYWLFLIGTLIK